GLGSAINDSHSRIARGRDATARAVPDRNAMAPPELTRDAPIADIGQPIGENFALIIGNDLDLSFLDCCYGRISQGSHFAKPLRRDARLDHGLASIANTYREGVVLYLDEQVLRFQIGYHALACFEPIEAGVTPCVRIHTSVFGHHVDLGKLVPASHLEIVR